MKLREFASVCDRIVETSGNEMEETIRDVLVERDPEDAEIFVRALLGERYDNPDKNTNVEHKNEILGKIIEVEVDELQETKNNGETDYGLRFARFVAERPDRNRPNTLGRVKEILN